MMRPDSLRRLIGWVLVATSLLGAGSPHTHSVFAAFEPGEAGGGAPHAVTRHNPLSKAVHCHAVLRMVEDGCFACSAQRTAVLAFSTEPRAFLGVHDNVVETSVSAPRVNSPLPKSSRAPPAAPSQPA